MTPALHWLASSFREMGISGLIDISIMIVLIHSVLVWLQRTKRAASVLTGILIVAGVYLLARQFDLHLTAAVLHGFFAVFLVALVVIFQEELRYLFERLARWSLRPRRLGPRERPAPPRTKRIELLTRTLSDLADQRWGAILVLPGQDALSRHVESGQPLNGDLSEAILKSLFDPHSIGHDGAVILDGKVLREFGCHLPLSKNSAELRGRGTRHAAALGLAERVDALCLVVSEERGTITAARDGELRELAGREQLVATLTEFLGETESDGPRRRWRPWTTHRREKLVSVALAVALWFVLVHEARVVYRTFRVPVAFGPMRAELGIVDWKPTDVEVTLSGPRKSFYFMRAEDIRFAVKVWDLDEGETSLALSSADFEVPDGLTFESVQPRQVELHRREGPPADGG